MLYDALADFESQVQPWKAGVAGLETFNDAEGVKVMIKRLAEALHLPTQLFLPGVGERGMAHVVDQSQGLGEIFIQAQGGGYGAGNLSDFNRVGESIAEVVGEAGGKDLGLVLQSPERPGVDHAIAVPLELGPVGMRQLRIPPTPAHRRPEPESHERRRVT